MYVIINVRGHYEVYLKENGKFICSGDTSTEAAKEAEKCLYQEGK